jgi:phenylacetic acid degradation operon negative regulatory protein
MADTNNAFDVAVRKRLEEFSTSQPRYANSLILTIFGDAVCVHGGLIWLGSLIKLVEPLGINQRLVRTSVFRLTEKGILQSKQQGRRSFYSLTHRGFRQFSSADERIYRYHDAVWDGRWRLVFTAFGDIAAEPKEQLKKELKWLGFSRLAAGVYAHPTANPDEVRSMLGELQLGDTVSLMLAQSLDEDPQATSESMIRRCFNFDAMKAEYQAFIDYFEPLLKAAQKTQTYDEQLSFLLRTLLIHKFRRILLHEPELPHELVPANCLSHQLRELTGQLYKLITPAAERYFMSIAESENGVMPAAGRLYFSRFGGLGN